ncbi:hypothetical protein N8384_06485 [Candidatus Thioglobus sp.]|nr:hypothetical protein [Candidatus Thioglobus sp.]
MNYFIDPYGYKSRDGKFIKNLTMFNKPNVTNARINSDGYYYLVGSSRMARVDPKVIELITGKKTHNIKIDGATLSENSMLAYKVKDQGNFFIYGFDAFSTNKNRETFKEINKRYKIYSKELESYKSFIKYYNSDITIRSIQHLIKYLLKEKINKQYIEENFQDSSFRFDLAQNDSGVLNNLDQSNFSNYETYSSEEITKLAKLGTKNDIFIIFPKFVSFYYLFSKHQDVERKYFSAIRSLVENTEAQVWSFYGVNKITQTQNNFIDNGWHFKPQISNIIFKEVFETEVDISRDKIGVLVTKENINDYLSNLSMDISNFVLDDS